jgi:hypothetical protein
VWKDLLREARGRRNARIEGEMMAELERVEAEEGLLQKEP